MEEIETNFQLLFNLREEEISYEELISHHFVGSRRNNFPPRNNPISSFDLDKRWKLACISSFNLTSYNSQSIRTHQTGPLVLRKCLICVIYCCSKIWC